MLKVYKETNRKECDNRSLERAYIELLKVQGNSRLELQGVLISLRDMIAERNGLTDQEVQDRCEKIAFEECVENGDLIEDPVGQAVLFGD